MFSNRNEVLYSNYIIILLIDNGLRIRISPKNTLRESHLTSTSPFPRLLTMPEFGMRWSVWHLGTSRGPCPNQADGFHGWSPVSPYLREWWASRMILEWYLGDVPNPDDNLAGKFVELRSGRGGLKLWSHYSVVALLGKCPYSPNLQQTVVGLLHGSGRKLQISPGWDQVCWSDVHWMECGQSTQKAGSNLDMWWSGGLGKFQESWPVVEWWTAHGQQDFSVSVQIGGESGNFIVAAQYTSFEVCEFVGWPFRLWWHSECHEIRLAFYQCVWDFTYSPNFIDDRPRLDHDSSVSTAVDFLWVASISSDPCRRQSLVEGNDSHSSWFKDHRGCSSMCAFSSKD